MQDKYFLKVGPFEVSREKVQRCGFNENRMRKFLRKKQLEEDYREEYTKIGTKFKLNRVDAVPCRRINTIKLYSKCLNA
jgi:hypothetical protein